MMIRWMIDDKYPEMPWDELDTIVFDVGNVLLAFSPEQLLKELVPDRPDLYDVLSTRVFKSPYWVMLDHGTLTLEEAIEAMTGRELSLKPYVRQVMENWRDLKGVISEGVDALKAAKAHGKRVYVLSNYHSDSFQFAQEKYDFFNLVDDFLVSSREGLLKPDPAIYRLAQERFQLLPERTLFIDDTPANIEAALNAGWQGFCLNAPGKLRRFIGD